LILVDTNILIDIVESDPQWADWSQRQLDAASAVDQLAINDVIYAELSVGFSRIEEVEAFLAAAGLVVATLPRLGLFHAGKAFQRYRSEGGRRTGVLADFFIGAHAATTGSLLITRDPRRYRRYFPDISLLTPD